MENILEKLISITEEYAYNYTDWAEGSASPEGTRAMSFYEGKGIVLAEVYGTTFHDFQKTEEGQKAMEKGRQKYLKRYDE